MCNIHKDGQWSATDQHVKLAAEAGNDTSLPIRFAQATKAQMSATDEHARLAAEAGNDTSLTIRFAQAEMTK